MDFFFLSTISLCPVSPAAGSIASLTLDRDVVLCACERANAHGSVHLLLCVWVCVCPRVFESLVLHNSDSVCNILQSLDCLFMETVQ